MAGCGLSCLARYLNKPGLPSPRPVFEHIVAILTSYVSSLNQHQCQNFSIFILMQVLRSLRAV